MDICPDYQIGIVSSRYRNLNGDIRIAETIIILKKNKKNNNIKGQDYLWDEWGPFFLVSLSSLHLRKM